MTTATRKPRAPRPPVVDEESIARKVADMVKADLSAFVPLERDPATFGWGYPWSPGMPLVPVGIDPREPQFARPAPRVAEFPTAVNLFPTGQRLIPFSVLRDVAERVDVIRRCVEYRKAQVAGLDWDITLTPQAIKRVMVDNKISSPGEASQLARQQFEPEMARVRSWWEKPDRYNGFDWPTWVSTLMEEQVVLDAATIWPRRKYSGETVAFEIIDGSTCKPLLDHRGARPVAPAPAYQQILYGFPRGEFVATVTGEADAWTTDQLVYAPRYRRTWTPYGCSNVEQALSAADLYLKRIAWIRSEFTDGATPDTWLKTDRDTNMKPELLKAYEAVLNNELAGDDSERRHLRLLPPGMEPDQMSKFSDLYKPDLDEFLIKLICLCFDVLPTEVGFPPQSGIGGKGHQEGEQVSAYRRSTRPTVKWLEGLATDVSREFLGMPDLLQFTLIGYAVEDQLEIEKTQDSKNRGGRATINEARGENGLALFEFPEADEPFVVTGKGIEFLRGALARQAAFPPAPPVAVPTAPGEPAVAPAAPALSAGPVPAVDDGGQGEGDPGTDADPVTHDEDPSVPVGFVRVRNHLRRLPGTKASPAVADQVKTFETFVARRARRGKPWRDFEWGDAMKLEGGMLNKLAAAGDTLGLAAEISKVKAARPGTVSAEVKAGLVARHGRKVAAAVTDQLPSPAKLAAGWAERDPQAAAGKKAKPESDRQAAAQSYVEELLDDDDEDLDGAAEDFLGDGYDEAFEASGADDDPGGARRGKLLREVRQAVVVGAVSAAVTGLVSALCSETDDVAAAVKAWRDDPSWADGVITGSLPAALTAGTLDGCQAQGIANVRLVINGSDACEFCVGYDGRIMKIEDDSGMPPLHRGCSCSVEPLTD